jgi:hypothetical protein
VTDAETRLEARAQLAETFCDPVIGECSVLASDLRQILSSLATLRGENAELREGWKHDKVAALNAANEVATLTAERDALRGENARLTESLAEIANTDYRGNRSHESQLAHRALAALAPQGRTG